MVSSYVGTHTARLKVAAAMAGLLAVSSPVGTTLAESGAIVNSAGLAPVVAQHVAILADTPARFVIQERAIDRSGATLTGQGSGFLVNLHGAVLVEEVASGQGILLESGEAMPVREGLPYQYEPIESASLLEIGLRTDTPPDALFVGETSESLGGLREMELYRAELGQREDAVIRAESGVGLAIVLEGSVRVENEDGSEDILNAGEATEIERSSTVTGMASASVLMALTIGDPIDRVSATAPTGSGSIDQNTTSGNPPIALVDSDGDGLSDQEESSYGSDPNVSDTDQDGLSDGDEVHLYGSSPTATDTDGDMLGDYNEVMQHGTDPANPDTDGDGLDDHDELYYEGADPLKYDSDGDGLDDYEEVLYGASSETPDYDGDGLTDFEEAKVYGSYPYSPDSDGDMLGDYQEAKTYGTNPLAKDSDSDGLWDVNEVADVLTDPNDADTDGDGHSDGFEVNDGYDPLDPGDPSLPQS